MNAELKETLDQVEETYKRMNEARKQLDAACQELDEAQGTEATQRGIAMACERAGEVRKQTREVVQQMDDVIPALATARANMTDAGEAELMRKLEEDLRSRSVQLKGVVQHVDQLHRRMLDIKEQFTQ